MKDELLKEALEALEDETREYCEEKGLDTKTNIFSIIISKNLVQKINLTEWGIERLMRETKKAILAEYRGKRVINAGEAMMFYIGDEYVSGHTGTTVRVGIFDRKDVKFFCLI